MRGDVVNKRDQLHYEQLSLAFTSHISKKNISKRGSMTALMSSTESGPDIRISIK